jgi:hypothetical protein
MPRIKFVTRFFITWMIFCDEREEIGLIFHRIVSYKVKNKNLDKILSDEERII